MPSSWSGIARSPPQGNRAGCRSSPGPVVARTSPPKDPAKAYQGISAFLVDKRQVDPKQYTSRKIERSEDEWEHESIRLEPLNPEFQPFELAPDGLRVIAEWIRTLD